MDDAHQIITFKPVERAVFACFNHGATSAIVEVRVHWLLALGASEKARLVFLIRRGGNGYPRMIRPHIVNQVFQPAHRNQNAAASLTCLHTNSGKTCVPKREHANGAVAFLYFIKISNTRIIGCGEIDVLAVSAAQALLPSRQLHRRTA